MPVGQCSLTRGSSRCAHDAAHRVERDAQRSRGSTPGAACRATRTSSARSAPGSNRLPPTSRPIRVPTADSSPSETSEPKSRKWNFGSGLPASRALIALHEQRRLLVRDLRARRQQSRRPGSLGPGHAAQSPNAKMSGSRVVCERRVDDELVRAVDLESVERREPSPAPGCPPPRRRGPPGQTLPARRVHAVRVDGGDALARAHRDVEVSEQLASRPSATCSEQRRQDARRRFEQRERDVAFADGGGRGRSSRCARVRMADLGGELDAGRAGADDHDVDRRATRRALRARRRARTPRAAGDGSARHPPACRARSRARATPGMPKSLLTLPTAEDERVVGHARAAAGSRCRRRRARASSISSRRARSRPIEGALAKPEVMPVRHQRGSRRRGRRRPCVRRRLRAAAASTDASRSGRPA